MTTLPRTASQTTTSARCLREVLALDVADEAQVRRVEQLGGALDAGVALALLLADRQQRDARPRDAQHPLGEDRAHPRVLGEVLGGRVGVGADVEQDHRPGVRDHLDGEGRPVDAGQAPEAQDRGGHAGPGVAGGHDRVGLAAPDEVGGDQDRGVLLLAQRQRRVLVHADDLASRGRSRRWRAGVPRGPRRPPRRRRGSAGRRDGPGRRARAPGTTSDGPWSPPIASTATRTPPAVLRGRRGVRHAISALRRRRRAWARPPGGRCSSRSSGRRGAAASCSWQCGHSSRFGRSIARCARRSPWRACETRRLGTPMGSWAPCQRSVVSRGRSTVPGSGRGAAPTAESTA